MKTERNQHTTISNIPGKNSILSSLEDILVLDKTAFDQTYKTAARTIFEKRKKKEISVSGLLAISNFCRNNCLYCGLRRKRKIKRYRLDLASIKKMLSGLKTRGLGKIFLISGEDGFYSTDDYIEMIETSKTCGLEVNLAAGVFPARTYRDMKSAGLDMYTLKFESSNEAIFSECKPDITYKDRLKAIEDIRAAGLMLGSGNIVGLKNQTTKDLADDIRLMIALDIDWAPVVPYMPAPDTPMAAETPMGDIDMTLKIIALLRILIPDARITAGQPRQGSSLGFADPQGNRSAIEYGADILFVELTPLALAGQFDITANRKLPRLKEIKTMCETLSLRII